MELIDEKHESKTHGTQTPCGKLYTTLCKDKNSKIIKIIHKLGKEGGCRQSHLTAHIISQDGNIQAYRLVQRIKRMITNKDIEFKNKNDREVLEKKLLQVENMVSLKSIATQLERFECGQSMVIENGVECSCCIDAMSKNIKELIK